VRPQRNLDCLLEDPPLTEHHPCAHAHRVKSGDRYLDALQVIFLEGVRMKLFAVDLEPDNAVYDHIDSLGPDGDLDLNGVARKLQSCARKAFRQALALAVNPRPDPTFVAGQTENKLLEIELINSPTVQRPIDSCDRRFEILINNHSPKCLDEADMPGGSAIAADMRIPVQPHTMPCLDGFPSVPLTAQPCRILWN